MDVLKDYFLVNGNNALQKWAYWLNYFPFLSYPNFIYIILIDGQLEKVISWLIKKISSVGLERKKK